MVTSILHRATGIALSVGALILVWWLVALAAGEDAFNQFKVCMGSPIGIILLIGWTWSFFYHLCNGIRHLVQDAGAGYTIVQFVRSSWASVIVSLLLTLIVVGYALSAGGAA
jgi:succinate dehydrogenase / fumarate reductase cytochrome b subunit